MARKPIGISNFGLEKKEKREVYCRKCQEVKTNTQFLTAVDKYIDANGYLSVCKTCIETIYFDYFRSEKNVEKAFARLCKSINVKFDRECFTAMMESDSEKAQKAVSTGMGLFSLYMMKLRGSVKTTSMTRKDDDSLIYSEVDDLEKEEPTEEDKDIELEDDNELVEFWGENFSKNDYVFLERELSEWKKTHKCDTKAEEMLLKELCYKSLEIRKRRLENAPVSTQVAELQALMKTASVDPAKTTYLTAGKSQDTFSHFIKTIENVEPADYYKDKDLFRDFDNIGWYFRKYVTRPIKNFITQSRDFNVEHDDEDVDEFDEVKENESE